MTARVLVSTRVAAPRQRVFDAFVGEIGDWWRPSPLFPFSPGRSGRLEFDAGPDGRLVEHYDDGSEFEVGRIGNWDPPAGFTMSWRVASFERDEQTELHVRFEAVEDGTRLTVEHFGWDTIPREHAARHGFPLHDFQARLAEHWRAQLDRVSSRTV